MTNQNFRGAVRVLMLIVTVAWGAGMAAADIYVGDPGAFDFTIAAGTTGPTFDIDTDAGTTNPATVNGALDGGVMVFRYNNLSIAGDVTVTVTGSNPLAIAAAGDVSWAADISVANGVAGGGAGGIGGPGGTTLGQGGGGGFGAGGAVGRAAGGGGGPGAAPTAGSNGGTRRAGNAGASGGVGTNGQAGVTGVAGSLGFGSAGASGTGGGGGTQGTGSTAANGGGGAPAGGGAGAGMPGATNANSVNGGNASASGVNGSGGNIGAGGGNGTAGNPGNDASFTAPPGTLALAAGNGGGGGGGGGQGAGGQGGGQGGGGSSGGGGGGAGGVNGTDCSSSDATGGTGGQGGAGGTGGGGGTGGDAGAGGAGGMGANGGGAIVIAALGLLDFSGEVDISAGSPVGGSGGAGPVGGSNGTNGGNPEANGGYNNGSGGGTAVSGNCSGGGIACGFFNACNTTNRSAGSGGTGSQGGPGGGGGQGGPSGTSAGGGTGGFGTPGMVKLQGSVVLASSGTVRADNIAGAAADENGKFTFISNMRLSDVVTSVPSLTQATTESGITSNDPILTGPAVYNAPTILPIVPQLAGDLDTHGILQASFYNDGVSQTLITSATNVDISSIADANTVFDGFDQIFVENTTGGTVAGQGLIINAFPAIVLPDLAAGEIWTTHVPAGATITAVNSLNITAQPVGGERYVGENISLTVAATGGNPTVSYQWSKDGIAIPLVDNATAQDATLVLNALALTDAADYRCVVTDDGALAAPGISDIATVIVYEHLAATVQPEGGVRFSTPPDTFTFYFGTTGGFQSVTYTWTKDSTPVQTGPSPVLHINPVTQADAGVYECTAVDNGTDTVVSATASLLVDPLGIAQQPENVLVVAGDEARLEVVIEGGVGTVNYQWYEEDGSKAEVLVPGATTSELVFNPSVVGDSGIYFCRISDDATSIDSATATIVVATPLQIIGQPASATVNEGAAVSFAVTTNGGQGPISYTWKFAGNPIATAPNSAVYTINSTVVGDAGLYSCEVSDNVDTLTSADASLTVESSVPAADYRGMTFLLVLCAALGAFALSRKRKSA